MVEGEFESKKVRKPYDCLMWWRWRSRSRAEILAAAEQQPAGFPEDRGAAITFHVAGFPGTEVVHRLIHVAEDVEAVEDVQMPRSSVRGRASDGVPTCLSRRTRFWK